jgi:Concanavalin A-like lectin/glucanases superfamily
MTTALFFLIPIGLLTVVWSVCFVGCTLPTSGEAAPFSDLVLKQEPSLLAYWPLNDPLGSPPLPPPTGSQGIATAVDLSGKNHVGSYLLPPIYPTLAGSAGPMQMPNGPVINLQAGSIVPGDAGSTTNSSPNSADFEGGYVSIPWSAPNMLSDFTLEAWIQPNPNGAGLGFNQVIFSALTANNNVFQGFRVLLNTSNQLALIIGDGTANPPSPSLGTSIDPMTITYIAVTCQSGSFTLFAAGIDDPATQPQSVGSFNYVAADPTQPATYFIGAGENEQALRMQNNVTGAPEFPFLGQIQSVALYGSALSDSDLQTHFSDGSPGGAG